MTKDKPQLDFETLSDEFESSLTRDSLRTLARKLRVTSDSLKSLGVGWSDVDGAWTFPERDGWGNVVGILRRYPNGRKKVVTGSQRGLYLPRGWQEGEQPVFVPEGASDVAALISSGLRAIGRPSCTGGVQHLIELLTDMDVEVLIVGENDEKEDGTWPGRDGAKKVAAAMVRELGDRVRWTLPPKGYKDVRDFISRETFNGE